jgi:hypothetical protein
VSRDGRTVAFIAGLQASASSLLWSCTNHLIAEEVAGERKQLADLGEGRRVLPGRVLWSGNSRARRFNGPGLRQKLLEKGYALFLPNPRGSFGQGESFTSPLVQRSMARLTARL